jgi:hypothetical protein
MPITLFYQFRSGYFQLMKLCRPNFMAYYVALICLQRTFIDWVAAMSAKRKTVPVTTGIHPPDFKITNWPDIERACRFKARLPKASRAEIERATRRFLWLEKMEAQALPFAPQKEALLDIAQDAKRLRLKLTPLRNAIFVPLAIDIMIEEDRDRGIFHQPRESNLDEGFQILHRLNRQRTESQPARQRKPDFIQEMKFLYEMLGSLELAANRAAKAMHLEVAPQLKGDAWNRWIAEICEVVMDAGLSATTSNDADKRANTATPFIRLVRKLQKLLPNEARRPDDEDQALAKAIQRATKTQRARRQRTNSQVQRFNRAA